MKERQERERAVNRSSYYYDFKLDNRSENRDLNDCWKHTKCFINETQLSMTAAGGGWKNSLRWQLGKGCSITSHDGGWARAEDSKMRMGAAAGRCWTDSVPKCYLSEGWSLKEGRKGHESLQQSGRKDGKVRGERGVTSGGQRHGRWWRIHFTSSTWRCYVQLPYSMTISIINYKRLNTWDLKLLFLKCEKFAGFSISYQ